MAEPRTKQAGAQARARSPLRALGAAAGRGVEALLVVVLLASLVFFALRLLPGDPARLVLGDQASPAEVAHLHARLHTDEPLGRQYARYLAGLATLDLGESLRKPGVSARARIASSLAPTAELAAVGVGLGAVLGVLLAVLGVGPWLGARKKWVERAMVAAAAAPLVAFAPLLTLAFAVKSRLVPLPGDPGAGLAGLLFAGGLLAVPLSAHVARTGRAALVDLERGQFLAVAAAKGAAPSRVYFVHALPAAAGPILTVVAAQLGALLGGAVVLERLFERWGLGTLILEAYAARDLPVLEGAVVAAGALFVAAQSVAAFVHALVDPRVRA